MTALVVDQEERVLLQVRSKPWAGRFQGLLELPQGHLDVGESIIEAAARELREETGLTDFLPSGSFTEGTVLGERLGAMTSFVVCENGDHAYLAVCIVGQAAGTPRGSAESADPAWYSREAVAELLDAERVFPLNAPMLRWHFSL